MNSHGASVGTAEFLGRIGTGSFLKASRSICSLWRQVAYGVNINEFWSPETHLKCVLYIGKNHAFLSFSNAKNGLALHIYFHHVFQVKTCQNLGCFSIHILGFSLKTTHENINKPSKYKELFTMLKLLTHICQEKAYPYLYLDRLFLVKVQPYASEKHL